MIKTNIVRGIAAPLLLDNIDTDTISPAARRSSYGKARAIVDTPEVLAETLFAGIRYDNQDKEVEGFVLNQAGYRQAAVLVTGRNFGCGSSRETAVDMLFHFGIRAVIALSFGDIFFNNCFAKGVVPVVVDKVTRDTLAKQALPNNGAGFLVDVKKLQVCAPDGQCFGFHLPKLRQRQLVEGLDEIGVSLGYRDEIRRFQKAQKVTHPWIYETL